MILSLHALINVSLNQKRAMKTIAEIPVHLNVTKRFVDVKRVMAPPKPRSPGIRSLPEPSLAAGADASYELRKSWRKEGMGRTDEHLAWKLV